MQEKKGSKGKKLYFASVDLEQAPTITGICPVTVECVVASGNFPVVVVSVAVSVVVYRPGCCRVCLQAG